MQAPMSDRPDWEHEIAETHRRYEAALKWHISPPDEPGSAEWLRTGIEHIIGILGADSLYAALGFAAGMHVRDLERGRDAWDAATGALPP